MIGMNTFEYWTYQNVWLVWILTEHQLIQVYILRLAQRWRKIHLRWAQRWRKIRHGCKLCIVLIIDSDQELKIVLKILCLKKLILCWQNSINFTKSLQRDKENLELLGEALGLCFSKPTKACGIKWINLKCNAMKITLENYGAFLMHAELLTETDSKPEKCVELKVWANKWKDVCIPICMSILTFYRCCGD